MKKFILAAFILYLPFQLRLPNIPFFNIINIFLVILFIVFLFARSPNPYARSIDIPLLLFLIIWLASFAHTMFYPPGVWKYAVTVDFKRLISLVLAYFVFSRCIKDKKDMKFLFYVSLLSLVLVALHTWRGGVLAGPHFADFKRSSGPFAQDWKGSDIAGGFLATFTPFLLAFTLLTNKKILKLAGFGGLVVCSLGLFATYSRGSILALGIASIICILLSVKQILKTSKITSIIIFVAFIGIGLNWEKWVPKSIVHRVQGTTVQEETYSGELYLDESSQSRMKKWEAGLEIFKMNPLFGVGYRIPEFIMTADTHNSFIQIAAEMGIFGFLIFIWFLISILIKAKSLLKTEFDWLGIGFIGCVISFILVNMFYSNFFRDTVVGTFWVLLGMLASAKKFTIETAK
jgi:O-antigen ligase